MMTNNDDETVDANPASIEELKRQELERAPASASPLDRPRSDPEASAARDFVQAARERDAADLAAEQAAAVPASTRRSTWIIGLAVLVAAQILAGGAYFALRTLQDDPVEVVIEATEPETIVAPTSSPTPEPTVTPPATPTPVPPTPTWLPVQDGPRSPPFTFIATAADETLPLFDEPSGTEIFIAEDEQPLAGTWPTGAPMRLRVVSGIPGNDWVQVALPGNGMPLAWVESEAITWSSTNRILQINVMDNQARVFEGNNLIFQAAVATGSRQSPTPQLQSWILQNPAGDKVDGAQATLTFADEVANRSLAILPVDDDRLVGEYVTDGEMLLATDEAEQLAIIIGAGAKMEIVGTPGRPTPTPVPTPTPGPVLPTNPTRQSEPLDTRCPGGSQGTPPNCYRVVDRESVAAPCAARQVILQNRCMILAGDPERIDVNTTRCPDTAVRFIGGRCYTDAGPIPTRPGDCPDGSTEVAGECRQPT